MTRSDTLAAQVAALDMVMTAIDEGRNMRAFVGGMLTAAKRERDYALEAENDPIKRMYAEAGVPDVPWDHSDEDSVNGTAEYKDARKPHNDYGVPRTDPFRNAISVRAAYAFSDWPPRHE